jgi:hypothetical protein
LNKKTQFFAGKRKFSKKFAASSNSSKKFVGALAFFQNLV